ncbi:DUF4214 domain-containing protein [Marivita sp.]|uniref:DUF4214 domain-containing protein n=1 Tax=Marivita sp. TaxID=2003365 RepID=UPI003F6C8FC0
MAFLRIFDAAGVGHNHREQKFIGDTARETQLQVTRLTADAFMVETQVNGSDVADRGVYLQRFFPSLGEQGYEQIVFYKNGELTWQYAEGELAPSNWVAEGVAYMLRGNDTVFGNSYDDVIGGFNGNDQLSGDGGDDELFGGSGDDLLIGGLGNDWLYGDDGYDVAVYSGNMSSYSLVFTAEEIVFGSRIPGHDGIDALQNIEALQFGLSGDYTLYLENLIGTSSLSAPVFETFIELYIAYFNRAPDALGLNFWGTAFANGVTLEEMATYFIDQDETRTTYPDGTSNTDFVTAVYDNVLGRIPDQDGFEFWVNLLNRSEVTGVTRDQFILEVLRGVQDDSSDRAYLDAKVDIGAYFAVHRGMSDTDNAADAMALFDGSQGSVANAVAAIDGYYQDALDPNNGEFLMQVVGILDNPFT